MGETGKQPQGSLRVKRPPAGHDEKEKVAGEMQNALSIRQLFELGQLVARDHGERLFVGDLGLHLG